MEYIYDNSNKMQKQMKLFWLIRLLHFSNYRKCVKVIEVGVFAKKK